ncbi:MAG TPA: hypothetical protein VJ400_03515, partial [Thermoplasmata archaeon]|nr:hypothetical protein [Thermoplasmata archaeon]
MLTPPWARAAIPRSMHDNTTRRGLGVAIFIVAILGIAAVGAAYLLVSKVGRAGGVANDPAYVAAMSYAGPATDVAGSTGSASQGTRGTSYVGTPVTPEDRGDLAVESTADAAEVANEAPGSEVASEGTDVQPTPDPGTDAPSIDEWDAATFEAGSPLGEMERAMPSVENGGTVGEVVGWFEPPADVQVPEGAQDVGVILTPPSMERQERDDNCTFRESFEFEDADGDRHPEYVHYRSLLECAVDGTGDGIPEWTLAVGRDVELWDNDSSGQFNALEGRQGARETVDPDSDGTVEYVAQGLWTLSVLDANEDRAPEHVLITF